MSAPHCVSHDNFKPYLRRSFPAGSLTRTHRRSVDLFVRQSNNLAIGLYESLGYMIYRRVQAYYGGGPGEKDEDAYGACSVYSAKPSKLLVTAIGCDMSFSAWF